MTESREVLRSIRAYAMHSALCGLEHSYKFCVVHRPNEWEAMAGSTLDADLAHPSVVLSELENAPCQTCKGVGTVLANEVTMDAAGALSGHPHRVTCGACGGSGKLGRDGVLRALGPLSESELAVVAERAGWRDRIGGSLRPDVADPQGERFPSLYESVFAPVPEPSEGARDAS